MKLLLLLATAVTASFDRCSTDGLVVRSLIANPNDVVHASQPTSIHIGFTVPDGSYVPGGIVEISSKWSFLSPYVQKFPLSNYMKLPLYAGDHDFDYNMLFPIGLWGRVVSDIKVRNVTGEPLLCARWAVRVK